MKALDIKGLTKTYKGGVQALKGVDLTVQEGDFFALLGPNGAGKSTTIGIISSLVNQTFADFARPVTQMTSVEIGTIGKHYHSVRSNFIVISVCSGNWR